MLQVLRTLFILAFVVGSTFGQKGGKNGKGGGTTTTTATTTTTTRPPPSDLGSDLVACNETTKTETVTYGSTKNQKQTVYIGRCECGNIDEGFQTYTFMMEDVQRCFTTYIPLDEKWVGEKLPLMITSNCYGKDKLGGLQMKETEHVWNEAASQFGYARIGVSTPEGNWEFPNDGIINYKMPMPCSDSNSKDLEYMRKVFDFIELNGDKFDLSRVYAHGFSQNSIWTSVIGVCFNDQVRGIFLGASGMSIQGQGLITKSCGGFVSSSSNKKCKKEDIGCEDCSLMEEYKCGDCKYTPIYPCYTPKKPLIACLSDYTNDGTVNNNGHSSIKNMYGAMLDEGHDARLFRFNRPDDGTIKGSHSSPQNVELWQVGCLGLSTPCSQECEDKVIECTEDGVDAADADAMVRTEIFKSCMSIAKLDEWDCPTDCAPTFNMLERSQDPDTFGDEDGDFNFGDIEYLEYDSSQPASSLCNAEEQLELSHAETANYINLF